MGKSMILDDTVHVTEEEVLSLLPKHVSKKVGKELTEQINELIDGDDLLRQTYRDNIIGFKKALEQGKFKITSYLNAVRFCGYRISGYGVTESYRMTFPQKLEQLERDGATAKYISSVTTQYNQSKLVELIMKQAMIPVYIVNMDAFQEAVNTQLDIMKHSESDIARTQAANSLLNHLKPPEATKMELTVETTNNKDVMTELRELTNKLAEQQLQGIQSGQTNAKEVAHTPILEYVEPK